jgi:hypothetical protein
VGASTCCCQPEPHKTRVSVKQFTTSIIKLRHRALRLMKLEEDAMKTMDHLHEERELRMRPIPLAVALLLMMMGINIAATVLSLLAAYQG